MECATVAGEKRKADEIDEIAKGPMDRGNVAPYDVSSEIVPNSVVLNPSYVTLAEGADHIGQLFTDAFKKTEGEHSSVQSLLKNVNASILERKTENMTMCISGAMGSGKSSTINSLFSVGMVAQSDKSGSSVTLVPHKYSGVAPSQRTKFLAEVCFFSRSQRQDFFKAELAAYYRSEHDEEGDESTRTTNELESEDIDARDTVADAMHSLFLDHPECESKRATREFFRSAISEEDERILKLLNSWADKIVRSILDGRETVMVEASTPQDLLKQLEIYTREITEDDSQRMMSLWPLVSLVHCHFENPLSKVGVSILDAPGSSDNHIRRANAQRIRRDCSHAAVIVGASRANSEGSVSKEVKSVKGKGDGRILVIVTSCDEIDPNTLVGGTTLERQQAKKLQTLAANFEKQLNATMLELNTTEDDMDNMKLYRRKMDLDLRILKARNAERAVRIGMRSRFTEERLQEKLSDVTDFQRAIPVFCISNLDYRKHLEGFTANKAPTLSLDQTRIPDLRRTISEFPNVARLNEIDCLYTMQLPTLLGRVKLYINQTATNRKADIVPIVHSPVTRCASYVDKIFDRIIADVKKNALDALKQEESTWGTKAAAKCDGWALEFKSQEMLQLMNRDGRRKGTKKKKEVNMSAELLQISSKRLDRSFSKIVSTMGQTEDDLVEDLNHLADSMIRSIRDEPSTSFMNLQPFYDYVDQEKLRLRHHAIENLERVIDGLDTIKQKITTEDEDAYLVQAMLPIYAKVRMIKGVKGKGGNKPKGGYPAQRHLVFKQDTTKFGKVWGEVIRGTERDVKQLLDEEKDRMTKDVGRVFADFESGFDLICQTKESEDPAETNQKELLRVSLQRAEEFMAGEMKTAYEKLKKSFR